MNLEEKVDKILKHVEKMDRGIYGDLDNGTPGLIKENKNQEDRIVKLEESQKKIKYWIAGFSFATPPLLYIIKQKLGL